MPVKRFIAGAACPDCGAVDKIYVLMEADTLLSRHCVDCGFEEAVSAVSGAPATSPEADPAWSVVRLSTPPGGDVKPSD